MLAGIFEKNDTFGDEFRFQEDEILVKRKIKIEYSSENGAKSFQEYFELYKQTDEI